MTDPPSDHHIIYTAYLQRISTGLAHCATEDEQADAAPWEAAQYARLAKLWAQDSTEAELLRIFNAELNLKRR